MVQMYRCILCLFLLLFVYSCGEMTHRETSSPLETEQALQVRNSYTHQFAGQPSSAANMSLFSTRRLYSPTRLHQTSVAPWSTNLPRNSVPV